MRRDGGWFGGPPKKTRKKLPQTTMPTVDERITLSCPALYIFIYSRPSYIDNIRSSRSSTIEFQRVVLRPASWLDGECKSDCCADSPMYGLDCRVNRVPADQSTEERAHNSKKVLVSISSHSIASRPTRCHNPMRINGYRRRADDGTAPGRAGRGTAGTERRDAGTEGEREMEKGWGQQ